jgi:hypothetical protein
LRPKLGHSVQAATETAAHVANHCLRVMSSFYIDGPCVLLRRKLPDTGLARYNFRLGASRTNADVRLRSQVCTDGTKTTKARPNYHYTLANLLYLAKSTETFSLAVSKFKAVSLVADEARCVNAQLLQVFGSAFVAKDIAFGLALPPQLMPEMHIDLQHRKIEARISSVFGPMLQHGRGQAGRGGGQPGRGRGRGRGGHDGQTTSTRPKGDPLMATWQTCVALDNALRAVTDDGLQAFLPSAGEQEARQGHPCCRALLTKLRVLQIV